jgi:predicted transcriptional regulator
MQKDTGVRTLLDLHDQVIDQEDGYWIKIEVWEAAGFPAADCRSTTGTATSMRSLSQVLSDENRALLEVIRTARPASISELAEMTGRKQGNLSRTLKTMSRYGLVRMERADRQVRPIVEGERYQIVA